MEANNINKFYKEAFAGFEHKVSGSFWRKLKWRLFWFDFRYYLAGLGALSIIGTGLFFGLFNDEQMQNTEHFYGSTVNYQTNVIQTLASIKVEVDDRFENANIPDKFSNENVIETKTNTAISDQKTTINKNLAINTESENFSEDAPIIIESDVTNTSFAAFELQPLSTAELVGGKPEIIYDSVNNIYFPQRKIRYSVALFVSPDYTIPIMKESGGYEEYLKYRKDHETASFSYSAGLDFTVHIKNWYVQTGLNYSKFSNSRNYNHSFMAYDSLRSYYINDTTWGYLYDPPDYGKPVVIGIDSSWHKVYNDLNEGKNEWNYLEIPLLVGYQFNKSRLSFDLATGVSYGILISVSGNVPSLTDQNQFDDLSDSNIILNNSQFNYIFQLGISYHLTPNWRIMAKPYYKQNLKSVFSNTYPIDQHFRTFGIKFGLIVDL